MWKRSIVLIFPVDDHLPQATTSWWTKGGRLRENWLYCFTMRSLTSAHSRKRPALVTTTFRISELVAYEGFDSILWNMEGWKWSLSTGVDSGTFTCIEGKGSTPRRAWGLEGWVADRPPAPRWSRRVYTKTPQWGFKKRANAPPRDTPQIHTIGRMVVIYPERLTSILRLRNGVFSSRFIFR